MVLRVFAWVNILAALYTVFCLFKKNEINGHRIKTWAYLWAMKVLFVFFCLFFAMGIGPHHFPPVYFISFVTFGIAMQIVLDGVFKLTGKIKWQHGILCALVISALTLNIGNLRRFHNALYETGGVAFFSEELNNMASNALDRQRAGIREVYFFPEWGFFMNFSFLTGSNIRYHTYLWPELFHAVGESHDFIRMPVWNRNQLDTHLPYFWQANLNTEIVEYVSRNGQVVFYTIVGWASP